MLHWSLNSLPIHILVESCAEENFTYTDLAEQINIPLASLSESKEVLALDGRLMSTHLTTPLSLSLSGNLEETIELFVIPSPKHPVVLCHPWLNSLTPLLISPLRPLHPRAIFVTRTVSSQPTPLWFQFQNHLLKISTSQLSLVPIISLSRHSVRIEP